MFTPKNIQGALEELYDLCDPDYMVDMLVNYSAGRLHAAVPQNICQFHNIFACLIKRRGKQMPQVVRKDLRGLYPGNFTQSLEHPPDLPSGERLAASGAKNRAGGDLLFLGIFQELPPQLGRPKDRANFTLEGHLRLSHPQGLHGDVSHLTDPDARGADCLQ